MKTLDLLQEALEELKKVSGNHELIGQIEHHLSPKTVNGYRLEATKALEFLNQKTGKNFEPVESNLRLIAGRMKEGASLEDCKMVIARKCRDWSGDPKMSSFLRPKTIFCPQNFWNYKGELV